MKKLFILFIVSALIAISVVKVSATAGSWSSSGSIIYYNDGKVGLGTSSPQTQLDVKAPSGVAPALSLESNIGYVTQWFYPSGYTTTGTRGYIGYGSSVNTLDLANLSGNMYIYAAGGTVKIDAAIKTRQVYVTTTAWPDYVFEKDYNLKPLSEVESYINENKHLPGMPAESDIEKNGLSLGDMQTKQMEKIEELTLYIIHLEKKVDALESKNNH